MGFPEGSVSGCLLWDLGSCASGGADVTQELQDAAPLRHQDISSTCLIWPLVSLHESCETGQRLLNEEGYLVLSCWSVSSNLLSRLAPA